MGCPSTGLLGVIDWLPDPQPFGCRGPGDTDDSSLSRAPPLDVSNPSKFRIQSVQIRGSYVPVKFESQGRGHKTQDRVGKTKNFGRTSRELSLLM